MRLSQNALQTDHATKEGTVRIKIQEICKMNDSIRLRLCFQSESPLQEMKSWYLLNRSKFKTIGEFLTDVREKFGMDKSHSLKCSMKGFLLPPWENSYIIRKEDEKIRILNEKSVIDGMNVASQQMEKGPPSSLNKSLLNTSKDKKKKSKHKRKRSESAKKETIFHSLEVKEPKRKKQKKQRGLTETLATHKDKEETKGCKKFTDKRQNLRSESLLDAFEDKEIVTGKLEKMDHILSNETERKQTISEKNHGICDKSETDSQSNSKKKKRKKAKNESQHQDESSKKAQKNDTKECHAATINTPSLKGNYKDKRVSGDCKAEEKSFEIIGKNSKEMQPVFLPTKVKSKSCGNHVYFGSSDDDSDYRVEKMQTDWQVDENHRNSRGPNEAMFGFESSPCVLPTANTIASAESMRSSLVASAVNTFDGSYLKDERKHDRQESETVCKVLDQHMKNYEACAPLHGAPRIGDQVVFKVLEMSLSYTPELSDYKEGVVQEIDSNGLVKLLLADKSKGRKLGDGIMSRKFELDSEAETEIDSILEVNWRELIDLKLIAA